MLELREKQIWLSRSQEFRWEILKVVKRYTSLHYRLDLQWVRSLNHTSSHLPGQNLGVEVRFDRGLWHRGDEGNLTNDRNALMTLLWDPSC
jgi:hypothetical protein